MAEMDKVYSYPATRKLKNGGVSLRMVSKRYTPHPRKPREIDINTFSNVLYELLYREGSRKLETLKQHGITYYDFKKQCVKDFGTDNIGVIKREFEGWTQRPKQD